jgi:hypothetical protein
LSVFQRKQNPVFKETTLLAMIQAFHWWTKGIQNMGFQKNRKMGICAKTFRLFWKKAF